MFMSFALQKTDHPREHCSMVLNGLSDFTLDGKTRVDYQRRPAVGTHVVDCIGEVAQGFGSSIPAKPVFGVRLFDGRSASINFVADNKQLLAASFPSFYFGLEELFLLTDQFATHSYRLFLPPPCLTHSH